MRVSGRREREWAAVGLLRERAVKAGGRGPSGGAPDATGEGRYSGLRYSVAMCGRCGCVRAGQRTPPRPATVEGILEPALLVLLSEGADYGYQLASRLAEQGFTPAPPPLPRVYEALQRLDHEGAIVRRRENSRTGPDRQRYEITPVGRVRLERWMEALRPTQRSLRLLLEAYKR